MRSKAAAENPSQLHGPIGVGLGAQLNEVANQEVAANQEGSNQQPANV
jgi:hypothetical protein